MNLPNHLVVTESLARTAFAEQLDPQQLIAITGMAGRFPGAEDVAGFWRLLMARGEAIRSVPPERWDTSVPLDPDKVVPARGGFLEGIDQFDAAFFGISPREAEDIDPQQRLLLEASWQALEDAGQPAGALEGSRTGVYVGGAWHDYELLRKEHGTPSTSHSIVGAAMDMLSARVSYVYKLRGPSLTVETGCSSSLVALHLACQALRSGEIDAALVCGVNLMLSPDASVGLTHFGGLSPDGRCKAFAASANGFVRGEGVVALFLKPLEKAQAAGDRMHGVLVRTAVNNDGGGDSLVTPHGDGQEELLRRAYADARVPPEALAYIEAHGTGTARGDPIEAGAIGRVLGRTRGRAVGPLAIGSVKTNIGHLEAAAGLASLVKVLLALEHRVVPVSLHAEELNPEIDFDGLNLRVVREPLVLPESGPLFMGVNSFGWGGTNAHVVVMSAPALPARDERPRWASSLPLLVPLSAHQEDALRQRARDMRELVAQESSGLAALAGTLAWRRGHLKQRAAFVARGMNELREGLESFVARPGEPGEDLVTGRARTRGRTAFVFPGQGAQWEAMGRALFKREPLFAAVIRRCARALAPFVPWDLEALVAGEEGDEWLTRVDMLQPVLWALSVALAELWRAAGIEPDVVVGHSQGEIAAATVAGILSDEDAARIVASRSALVRGKSGEGLMLAVELDLEHAWGAIVGFEDQVSLAVNNGPTSCVLSGDAESITTLQQLLEAEGTFCRLVKVDYASHSPQMDGLKDELLAALAPVRPRAGTTPLMSTVHVQRLAGPEMDAAYWVKNLREPVYFADALRHVFDEGVTHVVEISMHPVLAPAMEQLAARRAEPPCVLTTLRRDEGSPEHFARALARAYVSGLEPFGALPRHGSVALPAYPWQRRGHWVRRGKRRGASANGWEFSLVPSLSERGAWQGTLELGLEENPWLADHRVHDAVVVPGTALLTLALNVVRARTGTLPRMLCGVRFLSDLTLGEAPARVSALWHDDVAGGGWLSLWSLAAGAEVWTEHVSASARLQVRPVVPAPFPSALRERESRDLTAFYRACGERGLHYGKAFQGLRRLFVEEDVALGEVRLGEAGLAGVRSHGLHPALWDGALQVVLALSGGSEAVVPTGLERLSLVGDLSEPVTALWSHVVRCGEARFDIILYGLDERPLLMIEGLEFKTLAGEAPGEADAGRLFRMEFREAARVAAVSSHGSWVVCGEPGDGVGALTEALGVAGLAVWRGGGGGLEPRNSNWLESLRAAGTPAGVVYLAPRAGAGLTAQRRGLMALTGLARACASLTPPPRLTVVTAEAQWVEGDGPPDPGAALYWGFTRVLRREHPELQPLVLDIDPARAGWAEDCAAELLSGAEEDQVVLRGTRRHVGRLVRGELDDEGRGAPGYWKTPVQPFRLDTRGPGLWEGLAFFPLSRRAPRAHEVEVEVSAASLNFFDVMKAMGVYPDTDGNALRLGCECAGRVVAVGSEVRGIAVGDRVVACALGAFASHLTVRVEHVRALPAGMREDVAAALPMVMMTAWHALEDLARLSPGETVLIHSAAGGLGLAALQVARRLGARVLATAGSEPKRQFLRTLGIREVFDSRDGSWADGVRAATGGRGVDVVLNSLSGEAIARGLDVLAEDGRFIEVGKKDIYGARNISLAAFKKRLSLSSVDLSNLMERRPERFARLFSAVWAQVEAGELTPLPVASYRFAEAADVFRTMALGSHIGKFVLTQPETVRGVVPEPLARGHFRADATYLITGGLGALGLSLAGFLVERGARAVALLGRSAPDDEALRCLAAWRAGGVHVETLQVDLTDASRLKEALGGLRQRMPPLRGVFHAAGLLDDATLLSLRPEQLERVLAPKVDGARHLDEATAEDPLDLFVLFSSAAALIGNAGQAAYAAGNAFMDTLAVSRRRRGRPALSVQWGPFASIGLAARDSLRGARLAERGMESFPAAEAWEALARMLERDAPVVAYLCFHARRWFDAYPDSAAQKSWQVLRDASRRDAAGLPGGEFVLQLKQSPEAQRLELAEAKVRELAGRVLRLDPSAIDRETPFKALGLDSLMSLELRNRLESAFGLKLSPTLLWTYGSSRALADKLCEHVFNPSVS